MIDSHSKALRLLDLLSMGLIDRIVPEYDPRSGYEYCSTLEELGVTSCDEAMELIKKLVEVGVLRREVHDRVASCSKCGSEVFLVRTRCPYCGSLRFYRSVVIEHMTCGYVGLEAEFLTPQGRLLCPKCRRELKGLGVDSIRVADVNKCEECGEVFSVPSVTHECLKCGYENRGVELKPKEIYRYVMVPKGLRAESPLPRLIDAIRSRSGYEVIGPYAKVKGASGVEMEFDIVVRNPEDHSTLAVIDFVENLDQEKLLATFAKAYEVGVGKIIVVHRGEVDRTVLSMASAFKVRLLRLESVDQVAEEILMYLKEGG